MWTCGEAGARKVAHSDRMLTDSPCLLQALDVEVARAAFIRLRDVRSVELVNRVAAGLAAGTPQNLLMADVAAWQGNFDQAAKLYVAEGEMDKVNDPAFRL